MDESGEAVFFQKESDKKRFQCSLNSDGLILYMRAIQGHSGGVKALHHSIGIYCSEKRRQRRKTNSILHRPGSHERRARGSKPGLVETTKGSLQE